MENCFSFALRRKDNIYIDGFTMVKNCIPHLEVSKNPELGDIVVYFENESKAVHASIYFNDHWVITKWGDQCPKLCTVEDDIKNYPHKWTETYKAPIH